ncbi:uncharacterized protein WCC33_018489 [Rhinophrynus dorsalis]
MVQHKTDLSPTDRSDSSPDVIVKIEPEEDQFPWAPELNGVREIPPTTSTGSSIIRRSHKLGKEREGLESQRTHRESAPYRERERQRNVKFSEEENDVLIKKISENYDKILGKLTTRTSTSEKKAIWRDIVASVNSVSAYCRTTMQCKKRYADIKKKVKEKMAKQYRHQSSSSSGRRVVVSFWPYEKYLMRLISCESVLGLHSGRLAEEEDLGVSHLRPSWRQAGHSLSTLQTLPLSEDQMEEENMEASVDDASFSGPEKIITLSDLSPELEQDSQEIEQIPGPPSPPPAETNLLPSDPDPLLREEQLFGRSLHKRINHLSACVKAQTSVLRQTNAILQTMSSNMQNGFQQLVTVIQHAVSVLRPDCQPPDSTNTSPAEAIGHGVVPRGSPIRRGELVRGRMSRGRRPLSSSPPSKKNRGRL